MASRALKEPPQHTGTQRNLNQINSKVLSKASSIVLVLLDLLSVAVLIHMLKLHGTSSGAGRMLAQALPTGQV